MLVYLNGVEGFQYRQMMRKVGARSGCINYLFSLRSYKTDWVNATGFLDNLIVEPGNLLQHIPKEDHYDKVIGYIEFLNKFPDRFDFALALPGWFKMIEENTEIPIIPMYGSQEVTSVVAFRNIDLKKPSIKKEIRDLTQDGSYFHGANVSDYNKWKDIPLDSVNTGSWLASQKHGYTHYFDGRHFYTYYNKHKYRRGYVALKLRQEGYPIDYQGVLKDDWIAVSIMNLVAWVKLEEYLNERRH